MEDEMKGDPYPSLEKPWGAVNSYIHREAEFFVTQQEAAERAEKLAKKLNAEFFVMQVHTSTRKDKKK